MRLSEKELRRYAAFASMGARQALAHVSATGGRIVFYGLLLFIFSRIWSAAYSASGTPPGSAVDMLWYLAVTEWIILSLPFIQAPIEEDVRSGALAYHLPRPVSYPWTKVAEAFGATVVRLGILGIAGFAMAWIFAGRLPANPMGFLYLLPLGIVAVLVNIVFQVGLGICAFWLQDSAPLFWIWQKLSFLLGGLIVPLSLYPGWLKAIAFATPFAAMLYGPGETLLTGSAFLAAMTLAALIFWLMAAAVLLNWIFRQGCRTLDINGG